MAVLRTLYANRWVRYALTVALVLLVVLRVHPEHLSSALRSAHTGYVGLALVLTLPFLYLKALRWYLILRAAHIDATFAEASLSLIGGMGLALVTPARLGEIVRLAYLRDSRKWTIGGLVLIDKGFDVLALCGLSVAGAWTLLGPLPGFVLLLATTTGLAIVYSPGHLARSLRARTTSGHLGEKLSDVWSSLDSLSLAASTVFLLLTLGAFAIVLLQFGIILLSWHSWSLDIVALTFPLVVLTNVLPLTIGGLGIREGAAALLLAHYGVSSADAALAAFLMFAINTALPGIVGAFLLPRRIPGAAGRPVQSLDHS